MGLCLGLRLVPNKDLLICLRNGFVSGAAFSTKQGNGMASGHRREFGIKVKKHISGKYKCKMNSREG